MRSALRITPAVNSCATTSPLVIDLHAARTAPGGPRCGTSEQRLVESSSGSMGTARSGKVDAGAAQPRFRVDGRAGAHVVADVGDVDVQRVVAVRQAVHPDGVVEIARGFAVDGDDGHVAEIAAAFELRRGDRGRDRPAPARRTSGGKLVRQVVLADDDLDVDAEIVGMARGSR